ncbi:hypothetical protein C8J56DRAFT_952330 [Mycena floridula]|nr:hypothetical protein C8J56DRAFT_952330 [Mycena floridula]
MSVFSPVRRVEEFPLTTPPQSQSNSSSKLVPSDIEGRGNTSRQNEWFRRNKHRLLEAARWTTFALHLIPVILLMLLAFPHNTEVASGIRILGIVPAVSLERSVHLSSTLTTILSTFVTVYSGYMQSAAAGMALRRQLHRRGTLTEKHDSAAAWAGLPDAVAGLCQKGPSFKATILTIAYLIGMTALQAVGPAVLSFQPVNVTVSTTLTTQGIPDFSQNTTANFLTGPTSLMTLAALSGLNFTGLANKTGMIYDLPVDDTSKFLAESFTVNGTYFNVTCGTLSGKINGDSAIKGNLNMTFDLFPEAVIQIPSLLSRDSMSVHGIPSSDFSMPGTIIILSTTQIQDSTGQSASTIAVNPTFSYDMIANGSLSQVSIPAVTVLGCNLTLDSMDATITSHTHALLNVSSPTEKVSSKISSFPVERRQPLNISDPNDSLIGGLGVFLTLGFLSPMADFLAGPCSKSPFNVQNNICKPLLETDQFLMESLDLYPDIIFNDTLSPNVIALHDLENALSRMLAIGVWVEAWGSNQKFANKFVEDLVGDKPIEKIQVKRTSLVNDLNTVSRLCINMSQVYIGLLASLALLAVIMPGILHKNDIKVESAGILQVIWLLRDHPKIQEAIGRIEDPSDEELRKAGRVEVRFSEKSS